MVTINKLSAVDTIEAGDQFVIYSQTNGDARRASGTTLKEFIGAIKNTTNVQDLADVTITSLTNNQVLTYDGITGNWVNQTPGNSAWINGTHLSNPFIYYNSGTVVIGATTPVSNSHALYADGSIHSSGLVKANIRLGVGDLSLAQDGNIFFFGPNQATQIFSGTLPPEGSQTAYPGSLYLQNVDGYGATGSSTGNLWVKETGTGNTGWALTT